LQPFFIKVLKLWKSLNFPVKMGSPFKDVLSAYLMLGVDSE
jgi:hypothetical protein